MSGSLISNLTRRPTPEPSDAGSHDMEVEELVFDDYQDASSFQETTHRDDDGTSASLNPASVGLGRNVTDAHIEEVSIRCDRPF